ncbi:hypothetical protein T492DRAFT_997485 [Pavlovales sp. CCMP2436]|nr:hypothetical protein T492DRAFT_997485 [Pavlovales sp. CCMP2436]|mmetsp:Transcript_32798/g.75673  ORF Transcript_32798/g.75673 Transcript_32798/m.75673 type:complete len:382 (+) Transcript_32798:186-1331(+)
MTLGPLLGVAHDPSANVHRLRVVVANFDKNDTGTIGKAFLDGLYSARDSLNMPGLEFTLDSSDTNETVLTARVESGELYAAMWINRGKTAELINAILRMATHPTGTSTSYNGTGAITLCWDEGRNPLVTAGRIGAPLRGALSAFSAIYAAKLIAALPTAVLGAVSKSSRPDLLSSPVGYTEKNLHPNTMPLAGNALTVGNILMVVFSLVIATAALTSLGHQPLLTSASPAKRTALLAIAMIWFASCVAAMYAILVVSIAAPGEWTAGSIGWARVWATQWLHILTFVPYLAALGETIGPDKMGILLMPYIIFNSIGGWNLDVADPGYVFSSTLHFFTHAGCSATLCTDRSPAGAPSSPECCAVGLFAAFSSSSRSRSVQAGR